MRDKAAAQDRQTSEDLVARRDKTRRDKTTTTGRAAERERETEMTPSMSLVVEASEETIGDRSGHYYRHTARLMLALSCLLI